MVDILLLQTISVAIASAGVFAAAVYYILQIRHQSKQRQTDMVMRLYATYGSAEFQKAYQTIMDMQIEDYSDYRERYAINAEARATFVQMATYFEGVGCLSIEN